MLPTVTRLLCDCSQDEIVPDAGVRKFADALQAAQPSRSVTVVALDGPHCRHIGTVRKEYEARLEALFGVMGSLALD